MPRIENNLEQIGRQLGNLIRQEASRVETEIDTEIQRQATLLRNDIVVGWPVDTGVSRAGWQGPFRRGYAHYEVVNNFVYAPVIEFGGYPGVGPKTANLGSELLPGGIQINGGIYPTQRPAAPVRRALSKRQLELTQALKQIIT